MSQSRPNFNTGGQSARQQRRQKAAGKRKFREYIKDFDTAGRCFEGARCGGDWWSCGKSRCSAR
jgi:hypothetical protein